HDEPAVGESLHDVDQPGAEELRLVDGDQVERSRLAHEAFQVVRVACRARRRREPGVRAHRARAAPRVERVAHDLDAPARDLGTAHAPQELLRLAREHRAAHDLDATARARAGGLRTCCAAHASSEPPPAHAVLGGAGRRCGQWCRADPFEDGRTGSGFGSAPAPSTETRSGEPGRAASRRLRIVVPDDPAGTSAAGPSAGAVLASPATGSPSVAARSVAGSAAASGAVASGLAPGPASAGATGTAAIPARPPPPTPGTERTSGSSRVPLPPGRAAASGPVAPAGASPAGAVAAVTSARGAGGTAASPPRAPTGASTGASEAAARRASVAGSAGRTPRLSSP